MSSTAEHAEGPLDEDPALWDELAADVAAFLRQARSAHYRQRRRDLLFYAYVVVLFGAMYAAPYTVGLLRLAEGTGVSRPLAADVGAALPLATPAVALGVLAAALSDALWRGPVVLDPAATSWVLPAPAAWRPLLRPRLRVSALLYASAGAVAAAAAGFLVQLATRARVTPLLAAAAVAGGLLGALAAGAAALVERHDAEVRPRLAVLPGVRVAVLALAVLAAVRAYDSGLVPGALGQVLLWSGPWGWAAQPLVAAGGSAPLWPLALVLLGAVALPLLLRADRTVAGVPGPVLRARVGSSRSVAAALLTGDVRGAQLTVRAASAGERRRPRLSLPAPRRRALVVPWRVVTGWLRAPARVVRAALELASAYAAVAVAPRTHGAERAAAGLVAGVLALLAAGQLLEAARVETDDVRPARALPLPFGRLIVLHGVAPAAALVAAAAPAALAAHAGGAAAAACAALLLALPALVAAGLVAACRGPLDLTRFSGGDTPFGNVGLVLAALWYARAPLAGLAVAVPPLLLATAGMLPPGALAWLAGGTAWLWWWAHSAGTRLAAMRGS